MKKVKCKNCKYCSIIFPYDIVYCSKFYDEKAEKFQAITKPRYCIFFEEKEKKKK